MRPAAEILADVKVLALEYRAVTGKPLGVTGELAEFEAHRILGVELAEARAPGFDAIRRLPGLEERIQIKGRAVDFNRQNGRRGRVPSIALNHPFEKVLLVLLDIVTLNAREMWEATRSDVESLLSKPGSKARQERNSAGISQFVAISTCIWRVEEQVSLTAPSTTTAGPRQMEISPERRRRWREVTKNSPFNRWLDAQVHSADGRFDLQRLYELAETFGIVQRYTGLNEGQIRMNLGNRLRRVVPPSLYVVSD